MRYFTHLCYVLLGSGWLMLPVPVAAQTAPTDTLPHRAWYMPHYAVAQMAGGQGMATAGLGYRLRRAHLELDLLAGYVPRRFSISPMGIYTIKVIFIPWDIALSNSRWAVQPLSLGGYISHTSSRGLNNTRDEKYPADYYWWSAYTRVSGFAGGRVAYALPASQPALPPRRVALYYELGTNDLYLVSWWGNARGLAVRDILTLGVGVKLDI